MGLAGVSPLVAALLLLSACNQSSRAADPATIECQRAEIGSKPYAMRVPKGSLIRADAASGAIEVRPPSTRLVRFFVVRPREGTALSPSKRYEVLANRARVAYVINEEIGGGSGGPEAELVGELNLADGTMLVVRCHDQSELSLRPDWCLPYLGTIEPVGSATACS